MHRAGEGVGDHSGGEARKFILHSAWMRPSKLRLPDSTEQTVRSCPVTASLTCVDERAGVADARGAAVADEREAELLEVRGEPGPVVVVGHHPGPGRERGLHPRLAAQAALHGVLRQQPGADHDRRVGGVRARGDRGDHHVPVVDRGRRAVVEASPAPAPTASSRPTVDLADRRLVARQVVARWRSGRLPGTTRPTPRRARRAGRGLRSGRRAARRPPRGASVSGMRSCGRFGPAIDGSTLRQVQLDRAVE